MSGIHNGELTRRSEDARAPAVAVWKTKPPDDGIQKITKNAGNPLSSTY